MKRLREFLYTAETYAQIGALGYFLLAAIGLAVIAIIFPYLVALAALTIGAHGVGWL